MKTFGKYIIVIVIGALVGVAGGLTINLIRGIQRIHTLESQMYRLELDGGTP